MADAPVGRASARHCLASAAALALAAYAVWVPADRLRVRLAAGAPRSRPALEFVRGFDREAAWAALGDAGSIGFLAEQPVVPQRAGALEARYYLSQFALAPVLLDANAAGGVTLANFPDPEGLETLLANPDVLLIRRLTPESALVRLAAR
jgi:hypothetical protein